MNIIGMMPVRNEAWVLELSIRVALKWVDSLVILCHNCTDGSEEIAVRLAKEHNPRITVVQRTSSEWQEMKDRQGMLEIARAMGATHLAMIDADEILSANLLPEIRGLVGAIPQNHVMTLPMFCPRDSLDRCHSTGVWGMGNITLAFVNDPIWHWTSGTRGGYDYHQRHPMGRPFFERSPVLRSKGGVLHLQFVNARRLRAKQALYKMQEITRWPGRSSPAELNARYNPAVYGARFGETMNFTPTPDQFLLPYWDLIQKYFHPESEPWQEVECRRLLDFHGERTFRGLDLFGVLDLPEAAGAAIRT